MNADRHPLVAYLATLAAIVTLTATAAAICALVDLDGHLPQVVAALGFIGSAVTGLIGVIGTFRPRQPGVSVTDRERQP